MSGEREAERDAGICEGKCLALCYRVLIDFPEQDFAGPLSLAVTRGERV